MRAGRHHHPLILVVCVLMHKYRTSNLDFISQLSSHTLLHNRLQLPRIPQRVLNNLITRDKNILADIVILLLGEVYPSIFDDPP